MINAAYNEVKDYLVRRISDSSKYRGMHLAQHQRLPIEKFEVIVRAIYDVMGEENSWNHQEMIRVLKELTS